ncbi:MAG: hypothetical protein EP346_06855 [Bacteroidetes bacterium]|nr:MAG: hypothetical protein EP346_06855 [Bacteroidota bacterium]
MKQLLHSNSELLQKLYITAPIPMREKIVNQMHQNNEACLQRDIKHDDKWIVIGIDTFEYDSISDQVQFKVCIDAEITLPIAYKGKDDIVKAIVKSLFRDRLLFSPKQDSISLKGQHTPRILSTVRLSEDDKSWVINQIHEEMKTAVKYAELAIQSDNPSQTSRAAHS